MSNLTEEITKELFEEAFLNFLAVAQKQSDEHYSTKFPTLIPTVLEVSRGRRYYKVIRSDGSSRSVHCFIDTKNGDVLKAATWKAPAKHARSNIFDSDNGLSGITPYGGKYLG